MHFTCHKTRPSEVRGSVGCPVSRLCQHGCPHSKPWVLRLTLPLCWWFQSAANGCCGLSFLLFTADALWETLLSGGGWLHPRRARERSTVSPPICKDLPWGCGFLPDPGLFRMLDTVYTFGDSCIFSSFLTASIICRTNCVWFQPLSNSWTLTLVDNMVFSRVAQVHLRRMCRRSPQSLGSLWPL